MASNDVIQNRIEFELLKCPSGFSQTALRILVKKIKAVCLLKNITHFDGASVEEFDQIVQSRLDSGSEPILKLLFRCIFGLINADIQLFEVFNEDPVLFAEAIQQQDLSIFYNVYPNNTVTQTVANPVS
jgi:hypothetical protein